MVAGKPFRGKNGAKVAADEKLGADDQAVGPVADTPVKGEQRGGLCRRRGQRI